MVIDLKTGDGDITAEGRFIHRKQDDTIGGCCAQIYPCGVHARRYLCAAQDGAIDVGNTEDNVIEGNTTSWRNTPVKGSYGKIAVAFVAHHNPRQGNIRPRYCCRIHREQYPAVRREKAAADIR